MLIEHQKNLMDFLQLLATRPRHYFWSFISYLKHKNIYFLDANILAFDSEEPDKRVKKLRPFGKKLFVTNTVNNEFKGLLERGLSGAGLKYKTTGFHSLREKYPNLCPLYYNMISRMYNPSNIASPEFFINLIQARKLRGQKLDRGEEKIYNLSMDRLKKGADTKTDKNGKPLSPIGRHLNIGASMYYKKKMKDKNSPSLMNDYRNAALIMIYTLINKCNTTFVTADHDVLPILFNYAESLAQESTLNYFVLSTLTDTEREDLFKRKTITRNLNFKEFKEFYNGTLNDILNPYWKKDRIYFSVMFWDDKAQKYLKEIYLNFNNLMRETALHMHGPMSCYFAKNDTHGNWLGYRYYWPPLSNEPDTIKVEIVFKKIFNRKNIYVSDHVHLLNCQYAMDDVKNNLRAYLGFTP